MKHAVAMPAAQQLQQQQASLLASGAASVCPSGTSVLGHLPQGVSSTLVVAVHSCSRQADKQAGSFQEQGDRLASLL